MTHAVTQLLGSLTAPSLPSAGVLELLTTELQWDVGAFWVVNDFRLLLECAHFYNRFPDQFSNFETVTRARRFVMGEGLPGRVWTSCTVVTIEELANDGNFPRISVAQAEGLHTGLAFPLHASKEVLGVIEMFSREKREPTAELKEFLFALGGQIGMFMERLSTSRALDSAEAQFRLLAQATMVGVFTIDEHSTVLFANQAVERIFGYRPEELIGGKLTTVMPEYLGHLHEHAVARYVHTREKHVSWDGIPLPGLHKDGHELPLMISFGEFLRAGKLLFTGIVKLREP